MAALLLILPLDHESLIYLTFFLVLILSGLGLPVPEEVTLLLGGYLAYLEFVRFWPTVYILIAGIMAADLMGYLLGRFAGDWVERRISSSKIASLLLDRAKYYFEKHGEKVILLSRPLIGVRVLVPILAGHFKMNVVRFFLYDMLAAIPWTLFFVSLSYHFGSGIDLIIKVRGIKYLILITIVAAIIIYAARLRRSLNTRD